MWMKTRLLVLPFFKLTLLTRIQLNTMRSTILPTVENYFHLTPQVSVITLLIFKYFHVTKRCSLIEHLQPCIYVHLDNIIWTNIWTDNCFLKYVKMQICFTLLMLMRFIFFSADKHIQHNFWQVAYWQHQRILIMT